MIKILCVGKIKESYLTDLINDYKNRISKYHKIEIIELKDNDNYQKEIDSIIKNINRKDYNIGLGRVFRDEEAQKIVKFKNQINTKDIVAPLYAEYKDQSDLVKRQVIDYYYWLVQDFLHAVDRNTMMFGLEARTPFLDKRVYEVARHLPSYAKVNKETTKPALRLAAKQSIPNEAYKKKKLGFPVPLREWIREDDLYQEIKTKFDSKIAQEIFDHKRIIKLLEDHKSGKKDCYKKVWTIYTFLVWYDQFFA